MTYKLAKNYILLWHDTCNSKGQNEAKGFKK
jgi:hypothetical protein